MAWVTETSSSAAPGSNHASVGWPSSVASHSCDEGLSRDGVSVGSEDVVHPTRPGHAGASGVGRWHRACTCTGPSRPRPRISERRRSSWPRHGRSGRSGTTISTGGVSAPLTGPTARAAAAERPVPGARSRRGVRGRVRGRVRASSEASAPSVVPRPAPGPRRGQGRRARPAAAAGWATQSGLSNPGRELSDRCSGPSGPRREILHP